MIEAIGSFSALRDDDFVRAGNDVRTSPLVRVIWRSCSSGHAIGAATVEDDLEAVVTAEGDG